MSAAPSATAPPQPPRPSPPSLRTRKPDFFDRVHAFWQRVTEGLELQQLWAQFQTEARSGYRLYSRDVEARSAQPHPDVKATRWQTAKEFFWAILMKLSPAKRVILLLGLFMLLMGSIEFNTGNVQTTIDLRTIGGLLILLLLILETADRVVMKRDLEIAREIQTLVSAERSRPSTRPRYRFRYPSRQHRRRRLLRRRSPCRARQIPGRRSRRRR